MMDHALFLRFMDAAIESIDITRALVIAVSKEAATALANALKEQDYPCGTLDDGASRFVVVSEESLSLLGHMHVASRFNAVFVEPGCDIGEIGEWLLKSTGRDMTTEHRFIMCAGS